MGSEDRQAGAAHQSGEGTKREATAALAEFVVQCNQGALVNSGANVNELLDAWIERARHDPSPSTVRATQFFIELYLRPTLGKVPLRKLGPAEAGPARHPPT